MSHKPHPPVWRRSSHSTQGWPVMGSAAGDDRIRKGISASNSIESPSSEGKGNSSIHHESESEDMRMLSDDPQRNMGPMMEWRAVCAERCKHGSGRGTRTPFGSPVPTLQDKGHGHATRPGAAPRGLAAREPIAPAGGRQST